MSAFHDRPLDYDFGLEFDYSVWTMDTSIEFLNVPWDSNYRDVVRFPNRADLNTYIDRNIGAQITLEQMSYLKPGQPILVDLRHNVANRFNYVRVRNEAQPGGADIQKDFYYFVVGVEYIAPDTTAIYVQLDVWQTFIYDTQFGTCYVERGHIGIANTKAFDNYGRDYLTVPEGFDLGSEMRVVTKVSNRLMGYSLEPNTSQPPENFDAAVVVVSTQDLTASPYKADGQTPQIVSASGSMAEKSVTGADLYAFETPNSFVQWALTNSFTSWRAQAIQGVYLVPNLKRYDPDWQWTAGYAKPQNMNNFIARARKINLLSNWRNTVRDTLPQRYRHLLKFLTFPYTAVELTTWVATPVILKPESWTRDNAELLERATLIPPAQRVEFIPRGYNAPPGYKPANWVDMPDNDPRLTSFTREIGDDGGDWLDMATRISNFPSVPIVSNTGVAYLAANYAGIHQAYNAADWSQQRALAGNSLAESQSKQNGRTLSDQTDAGRRLMLEMNDHTNQSMINNTNINTAAGMAGGLFGIGSTMSGGLSGFNPMAMAGNAINALADNAKSLAGIQTNNDILSSQLASNHSIEQASQRNMSFMRDTNKEFADFAANGDYAQTIAALDAKVRDAAMMPFAMQGQYGGEAINFTNNSMEVSLRFKMVDPSALATVGEYWLQFGYAVHRTISQLPADLMVMSKFTYWKLQKTYIRTAPMPETYRQTIRGILENGVTVWAHPDFIGFTDFADNTPKAGISL